MINEKFTIANIGDCVDNKMPGMTEADLRQAALEFSSIDPRVESFLKKNAEEFTRQHKSATHLVFSNSTTELVGYFTLAIKPITVDTEKISKTMERAVKKTGKFDEEMNTYTTSGFLIGQLGKNFSPSVKDSISGNELLQLALYRLKLIQHDVGGTIVFLEAQDNEKLLSFYQGNGFREFDRRMASDEALELVQLIKVL